MRNVLAIFCLALILAACGADSNYVGKWYGKTHKLEFLKDVTALLTSTKSTNFSMSEGTTAGQWKLDDNGGLLITVSMLGSSKVLRGEIENGDLVIAEDTFSRTPPKEAAEPLLETPQNQVLARDWSIVRCSISDVGTFEGSPLNKTYTEIWKLGHQRFIAWDAGTRNWRENNCFMHSCSWTDKEFTFQRMARGTPGYFRINRTTGMLSGAFIDPKQAGTKYLEKGQCYAVPDPSSSR